MLSLSVQGRRAGLLSQIEQDVLDDGKSIGSALRRCMASTPMPGVTPPASHWLQNFLPRCWLT